MSLRFRPITKFDKSLMANVDVANIKSAPMGSLRNFSQDNGYVVSNSIFGKINRIDTDENYKDKEYGDLYTRVGIINLPYPVLNQFLAGREAPIWKRLLSVSKERIKGIIDGDVLFDVETESEIDMSTNTHIIYDPERHVFGAKYLCYLLDRVNMEEALETYLLNEYIKPIMTSSERKDISEGFNMGKIKRLTKADMEDVLKGEPIGWLFGEYAIDLSESDFSSIPNEDGISRRDEILEILALENMSTDVTNMEQFPMASLLVSMKDNNGIEKLKSQIMDYVFVLPLGYRPSIEGRIDPLSHQYNQLANTTKELRDLLSQSAPMCSIILNKYKRMVTLVRSIFIGDKTDSLSHELKNYKCISDTITGKKGLMRDRMQGARADYSGRTVITCDPEMPIDTIGVPKKLLKKISEPNVIRWLKKSGKIDNKSNLITFSTNLKTEKIYEKYVRDYFKETRYGVIGRQPTLFYLGIQGFKIRPVDGDAIVLSPLIVMPFNADFDGDQMHFNMPITEAAQAEVRDRMINANIRYPKNGEITIVARHEILYGLWIAHRKYDNPDAKIWNKDDLSEIVKKFGIVNSKGDSWIVYEAVRKQLINVYDKINLNGKVIGAGIVALEYAMFGGSAKVKLNHKMSDTLKFIEDKINLVDDNEKKNAMKKITSVIAEIDSSVYNPNKVDTLATLMKELNIDDNAIKEVIDYLDSKAGIRGLKKLKAKDITNLIHKTYNNNISAFLSAINKVVLLGFSLAKIYPPNISTIINKDIQENVNTLIDDFNKRILEREELVNIGLEIEDEFTSYFNSEWDKLKEQIVDYLFENLDEDNGYLTMVLSGAKGDKNNIQQIFGLKGRIQKDDTSAFNSVITGNYSEQLTGLEHFCSSYGSMKGIADKVLATADPGYLSRKLEHAGSIITITSEDCKTTKGMEFTLADIVPFIEESQISPYGVYPKDDSELFYKRSETRTQFLAARDYLAKIIIGRYCINKDGQSVYIKDMTAALHFIEMTWGYIKDNTLILNYKEDGSPASVVMRSPVYCECPCCKKCYGADIAAGTNAPVIGRPVGFIAAQAIGEPGTQMTMKNFQKGGVVTEANLTSSFELIEDYFELHNLKDKKRDKRGMYSYDVLSPKRGYTKEQFLGNGTKNIIVTRTNSPDDVKNLIPGYNKIILHENTKIKEFVEVGDSFQKVQGYLNMREVLSLRGYDKAVSYLNLVLYNIFQNQDLNMKHFEAITAAMTCGILLNDVSYKDNNAPIKYGIGSTFKAGTIVTRPEFCYGLDKDNAICNWTLIGLKTLPKFKSDFLESILMENMDSYIPRAIMMNPADSMTNPITRAAFGLNIGIGSDLKK